MFTFLDDMKAIIISYIHLTRQIIGPYAKLTIMRDACSSVITEVD